MSETAVKQPPLQRIKDWLADNSLPIKLFFVSRLGLFLLVYLSLALVSMSETSDQWRGNPQNLFIDGWSRWDSGWYRGIAENGYTNGLMELGLDTAFFPVYPLAIRFLSAFIGDTNLSGIVISNAAFLAALIVLFKLLPIRHDSRITEHTLTLICFGAFSFFFSAVYSESLFLLAAAGAFYFCERKQYFWAACWAAVASATRLLGIMLVVPLLVLYLEQIEYDWRKIKPDILLFAIAFLGTFSFMIFLAQKFGNPLQFVNSQRPWGALNPLEIIIPTINSALSIRSILAGTFLMMNAIHLLVLIVSIFLALAYYRKIGLPYTVFAILAIVLSSSRVQGMGRYMVVVFPLFIAAAYFLKNRDLYHTFLYLNILLLALFSIMFSHWYWVA